MMAAQVRVRYGLGDGAVEVAAQRWLSTRQVTAVWHPHTKVRHLLFSAVIEVLGAHGDNKLTTKDAELAGDAPMYDLSMASAMMTIAGGAGYSPDLRPPARLPAQRAAAYCITPLAVPR